MGWFNNISKTWSTIVLTSVTYFVDLDLNNHVLLFIFIYLLLHIVNLAINSTIYIQTNIKEQKIQTSMPLQLNNFNLKILSIN